MSIFSNYWFMQRRQFCYCSFAESVLRDLNTEAGRYSVKQVFLKNWQNSQVNTNAGVFFYQSYRLEVLLKLRLRQKCFPLNFAKILRTFYRILTDDCFYNYSHQSLNNTKNKHSLRFGQGSNIIRVKHWRGIIMINQNAIDDTAGYY